jgi:hypothetical protein
VRVVSARTGDEEVCRAWIEHTRAILEQAIAARRAARLHTAS